MVIKSVSELKSDFTNVFEFDTVVAILIYGSFVRDETTSQSDIDICIVSPESKTAEQKAELLGEIWRRINADTYDIHLFEELPLYIQIDIIRNHKILFCDDVPALFEYFYFYRKLWADQEHKQSLKSFG